MVGEAAKAWLAFAACSFIWGTTWLAIKEGYAGLDPLWAASLRFFIASALLLAIMLVRRPTVPSDWRSAGVVVYVGVVLFAIDYGLIYWGEQFLASGLTAILFATMPLFVGLFAAFLIPSEQWTLRHAAGVCLGLIGLVVIFREQLTLEAGTFWPMVAIVGSAAAAGSASVVMRRWARSIPVLVLNGGAMFIGAAVLLLVAIVRGERIGHPIGQAAWSSLLYLAVFGSVVSFLLYLWLLQRWTAHRASVVALMTPLIAVVAGVVVLQETLTLWKVAGALLVLSGVGLSLITPSAAVDPEHLAAEAAEEG